VGKPALGHHDLNVVSPPAPVINRHAEQNGHDHGRQAAGKVADDLHLAGIADLIQQRADDLGDVVPPSFDGRGVNARETRRRNRVCSGGSIWWKLGCARVSWPKVAGSRRIASTSSNRAKTR